MKLLIILSLLIHILQIRSQEYDNANDIADILKIKDTNDTIEENDSVRKKLPITIASLYCGTLSHTRIVLLLLYY